MNDLELIHQLKQGNETAFKELVELYKNKIFYTVLNILQDTLEAEDTTQETFIQVYQSVHSFKQESSLNTWIYKIAVRKALEKLRKKKVKQKLVEILTLKKAGANNASSSIFYHPGIALEHKEKSAILFKAIHSLSTNQHIAFTLIKVEGVSYKQASEYMQLSIKAIESLVNRAKMNLQKKLEHYYKQ